ncbi:MAG: SpoIID/LytB domain-containing protein [bacterium]|nr:SpoIID/LytB domain-containing protein [bacterium]
MPKKLIVGILVMVLVAGVWTQAVKADECESPGSLTDPVKIEQCIGKFNNIVDAISKANATNASQLAGLNKQIAGLQSQIKQLDVQLGKLSQDIFDREVKKGVQNELLAARVRQDYIRKQDQSLLLLMFSSQTAADFFRDLAYREKLAQADQQYISSISGEIVDLNTRSTQLKAQQASLGAVKKKVDEQAAFLAGEVAKADKYVSDLSGKIAALTAQQQAILNAKSGTFQTTVGDVPLADDPASRPDYNPGFSPAFAAFSFGAPHFKGMSQYGAFGRAKSGQSAEAILQAYYGGGVEIKKDYDPSRQIGVAGNGRMDIETYTKRIYEMPNSWGDEGGMEALKAQAVAARSYALAWTREGTGGNICTTESCQVYKNANKGGPWEVAVNATRGWVLVKDGKIVSAWYSSTSGGYQEAYNALAYLQNGSNYTTPAFWDTPSGRGGWTSQAYEKVADSPWFYKGWYKDRSGDNCGRNHPWLTSEEMADVLNAWVVLFQGGGDSSRVTPQGSCWGGNPYSLSDLRAIGGYTSVSGVSVTYSDSGVTASVTFQTNKGSTSPISGADFKKAFNLRAPGRISLKSGLFNIERK